VLKTEVGPLSEKNEEFRKRRKNYKSETLGQDRNYGATIQGKLERIPSKLVHSKERAVEWSEKTESRLVGLGRENRVYQRTRFGTPHIT